LTGAGRETQVSLPAFGFCIGKEPERAQNDEDVSSLIFKKFIFTSLPVSPTSGPIKLTGGEVMEKSIESDINIINAVNRVVDQVVINEVPVVGDVPVSVSEVTVVEGVIDPVVVNVEQV
jgi:hypothetical protein